MPPIAAQRFILASGSPRRRELLAQFGIADFHVIRSDVDETQRPDEPPLDYVRRLSIEKAQAVAAQLAPDDVVLAADTVVIVAADTIGIMDGVILGKPTDADDARRMLTQLRARSHTVCTALTLMRAGDERSRVTTLTETLVTMRDYTDDEIAAYIASGDPFDKAGSYAIQHAGFHPVADIIGSYTNVMGLPLETLETMLAAFGWRSPGA